MPRVGLNKQAVVNAAIWLIEEKGYADFSMRELAESLNVRTASLYNHVGNMNEIIAAVGGYAVALLNNAQFEAIEGLDKDAAVLALAMSYREFAKEHPELYKVVMSLYKTHIAIIEKSAEPITAPVMQVLSKYPLDEKRKMHYQRILRSIIHGFLSQEEAGYFCHFPIDVSDSYEMAIHCYIDGLNAEVKRQTGQ